MRRRQFLATAPLLLAAFAARAAETHWLVGAWEGERKNVGARNRTGAERRLVVTSVDAGGASGKGQWIVSTGTVNVTLAIDGDAVSFTTPGPQGNVYRLLRNDAALQGSWTNQGRGNSGAIELHKQ
ncbi:MAG: hypothetical protein AB7R90_04455 [Reyranellaceae bacterium]